MTAVLVEIGYLSNSSERQNLGINGESNRVYRETINFNTIFEKNEELVEQ